MDSAVLAEYVLTGTIALTWLVDKVMVIKHSRVERAELADLLRKVDKHFDEKLDEIKEDIEELEDKVDALD